MNNPTLSAAIAGVVGRAVLDIQPLVGGGYSPAQRLRVALADGSTLFVKRAVNDLTAGWLHKERDVYEHLGEATFVPHYFGAGETTDDAGETLPFLILEDLSDCHWPPPWSSGRIDAVLGALDAVHATQEAWVQELPSVTDDLGSDNGWQDIAANSTPFLSLGLCSQVWLEENLYRLSDAAQVAPFEGHDLLHLDTRSDNLCFRPDGRACIVDWNWASHGNGTLDVAGWLPSLGYETGVLPESVLPGAPEFAAWLAGYFASHAGLPPPPLAPRVRVVQQQQLSVALPWACRALGLPPLV